jgi:hypothetical protein
MSKIPTFGSVEAQRLLSFRKAIRMICLIMYFAPHSQYAVELNFNMPIAASAGGRLRWEGQNMQINSNRQSPMYVVILFFISLFIWNIRCITFQYVTNVVHTYM